jgi:enamine deaminase RidA (YjgF/YER057c/UK114 family)
MAFEPVNPASTKRMYDRFHFSQGARVGDLLVCSGQIGTGADGKIPPAVEDEFRNAWRLVGTVLKEGGLDYPNIVEYTTFHVGLQQHMAAFMKVRDEFLSAPWPAWTAIGITELAIPGARVEIRIIARAA